MFSRASCQTREEHRLERFFLPGNLLFAPLLALLAASQHFAFLPTPLFWQTGDLPNTISRFNCANCLRLFPSGVRSFHLA